MKYFLIFLTILLAICCAPSKPNTTSFRVEYKGALKNMMHRGDISANADLSLFAKTVHFYALGAMENLKGEIQIFDSKPFNTMVSGNRLTVDTSFTKKATLLVYASVKQWNEIKIPDAFLSYEQLDDYIKQTAKTAQINVKKPFPFLIEGTAKSIDWHVINWEDGDTEHSHEKHIKSGLNGTLQNKHVEILGFYSTSHQAIFTHHTTNMHMHLKTADGEVAGHVDNLVLGNEMTLKLPVP